jgi:hypothetical protein
MDSIRASEALDSGSIPDEATKLNVCISHMYSKVWSITIFIKDTARIYQKEFFNIIQE